MTAGSGPFKEFVVGKSEGYRLKRFVTVETFISLSFPSDRMHDIKASKKMGEDILISWEENNTNRYASYNFQELIDMRINALDLLDRPMAYQVDNAARKIVSKK